MPKVKHTAPVRPPKRRKTDTPFFDDAIPSEIPEDEEPTNVQKQRTVEKFLNKNKERRYEELVYCDSCQREGWN